MTAYEGLMIAIKIIAFIWAGVIGFTFTDVLIPYAIERFRDRNWRRLHPGMSPARWRR